MELKIDVVDVAYITNLNGTRLFEHQRRKKYLIELIGQHLSQGSSLLDVGCASGDVSVELSLMGYNVHGIDFEPERLKRAKWLADKYFQDTIFTFSSFDDFDYIERFNGIVLGEVLEHFTNPDEMLRKAERILHNNGLIFVTAPNMPSLSNRLKFLFLGIFPDNNPEHKYYFDFRRFQEVVAKTHLKIDFFETRYANYQIQFLFFVYLQNMFLGWFPKLFRNSGNTFFAVLST